jgi:hypothetical protein
MDSKNKKTKTAIPIWAHLVCGWPFVLVIFGGAIGGGLGGLAYGINMVSFKTGMPVAAKVILNLLVGCAAIVGWLALAMLLEGYRARGVG